MTDQELAKELRDLAAHPWIAARGDQLRDLAHAITVRDRAEHWCEVDLFAAFAFEDTALPGGDPATFRRTIRKVLTVAGTVLVFLPIIVTWFGLMKATDAYGEALLAGGPEVARRPFLEMWQQGFDGRLADFLKFDNIAFYTLGAIGVLIVLTVTEHTLRSSAEDDADRDLAVLRIRLRQALTQASLLLGQVRLSSPARFTAELTRTAADINAVSTEARTVQAQMVSALTETLDGVRGTAETLTAGAGDVRGAVEVLAEHLAAVNVAYDDVNAAVERASASIDAVGSATGQAVSDVGDRLASTVTQTTLDMRRAFVEELERSAGSVRSTIGELVTATGSMRDTLNEGLTRSMTSVQATVSDLDSRVGELVTATANMKNTFDEGLARSMTSVQGTVSDLDSRVGELVTATAGIESAVDRAVLSINAVGATTEKAVGLIGEQVTDSLVATAGEFRRTFGDTGTEIREALGDWSSTAHAHASRIEMVSDTSGRTISLLEQTHGSLDRLPAAISTVLTELPAQVKEVSKDGFAELELAITRLRSAVDRAAEAVEISTSRNISAPAPSIGSGSSPEDL